MKSSEILNQIDIESEVNYEHDMIQHGYDKTMEKASTKKFKHMDHIQNFTTKLITPFTIILEQHIKELSVKRGVVNPLVKATEFISVNQLAYVSVYILVQSAMQESKLNSVAIGLSRHLVHTMNNNISTNKKLSDEEKQSALTKIESLKHLGLIVSTIFFDEFSYYHNPVKKDNKIVLNENGDVQIEIINLSQHESDKFFNLIQRNTRMNKFEIYVEPTQELTELLASNLEDLAWRSFANKPMIRKPMDWNSKGCNGGYYSKELKRYLAKGHFAKNRTDRDKTIASSDVIKAVNAIQSTPWRVNNEILNILNDLSKDIPPTLKKVFPHVVPFVTKLDKKYSQEEFKALPEEDKKRIRDHQTKVKRSIEKSKAKESIDRDRVTALTQAKHLMNEPNIYFPYDVDYRGRIYSMAMSGLNPQGSDLGKGLIQLSRGRKITSIEGVRWLQINMSNLMGEDKLKLNDRIKYVIESESDLIKIVDDPINNIGWHEWDKPVQGLACAIEYVKYLRYPNALIHIHVQLDGLCNGVQNLSAISLDAEVAPHLGLIKTEDRGDIYQYVCDGVQSKIDKILEDSKNKNYLFAKNWNESGLIGRKLTKKPVMTRSYSATLYGIKDGVRDYILDEEKSECFEELILEANWMGKLIWDTMNAELSGPMSVMEYFQKVAKVIGKEGKPLKWFTPSGMYCHYAPRKQKGINIEVSINSRRKKFRMMETGDAINGAKLSSSIAPNIIHSFDASHLVMTTNRCIEKGINDFAFVHDSFGTYPDAVADLLECTKEAWIEMYEENQLERLYQEWCIFYPECDIPHWKGEVNMGTLSVEDVRDSDFFFA